MNRVYSEDTNDKIVKYRLGGSSDTPFVVSGRWWSIEPPLYKVLSHF